MKRRDLTLGFVAAIAVAYAARGQQNVMPVIGFLSSRAVGESHALVEAFKKGLEEGGFVEGRSVAIEYRWADGQYDRLPVLAADLVAQRVAVIVAAGGPPSALAAQAATTAIPIVFTSVGNPVESGLVASLGRPGGNITGSDSTLTVELDAKRLELLHQFVPAVNEIGVLVNANKNAAVKQMQIEAIRVAAAALKLESVILAVTSETELETIFATLTERRVGGLLVTADPFFDSRREQLVVLAARYRIPAAYQWREFVSAGGLMSYGASLPAAYHRAGAYTGRILRGANPGELPVERPNKFELVINLKTANALELTVPQSLLARADEVIE
jgi:putative tryptophan/tyrosine transport system substrate-binding protein